MGSQSPSQTPVSRGRPGQRLLVPLLTFSGRAPGPAESQKALSVNALGSQDIQEVPSVPREMLVPWAGFALNCGSDTASLETWVWPSAPRPFVRFLFSLREAHLGEQEA